jgi:hypothetical protein
MTALGKILNLGTRSDHLDSKSRLKKKKKKKKLEGRMTDKPLQNLEAGKEVEYWNTVKQLERSSHSH